MAKHWFPVFSNSKCAHCGSCVKACPDSLLESESGLPVLSNPDLCRPNCFECTKACSEGAVGIVRPAKPCDCCSF
ncbi:4Fe-4S binding protein [Methanimicrococcus hacksteinii]|uniref:4Fe-4S binding protein n=1 Tax=Methanimicrococcus hacksteinii TaxID=3028293 RepID=UPI00298F2859|nr:4Fe-4S binding protein [Methanimicrococcus sp. At1]